MDQSGHYIPHHRQPQLFQPPPVNLPPPSQLHLPMPSFSRSNTLPPIPNIPANPRFPSSYQLSPPASTTLPPLPSSSSWSSHRTSSSREEVYAPHRSDHGRQDSVKRETRDQQPQHDHKDTTEDGMPTTSDFVKKLYK
ncbi:hypothetical protein OE88DRAFT_875834 [Heliocybe sulcata]|uniref:Uncharacterized protein n=1 Tax=Heliocybe sulcata TaxID=5364 RepID=A0A5C3MMI5_9AGAM|nr:hypothetical protein OE88DRAFT_875834 [Heliocybe sulcata]